MHAIIVAVDQCDQTKTAKNELKQLGHSTKKKENREERTLKQKLEAFVLLDQLMHLAVGGRITQKNKKRKKNRTPLPRVDESGESSSPPPRGVRNKGRCGGDNVRHLEHAWCELAEELEDGVVCGEDDDVEGRRGREGDDHESSSNPGRPPAARLLLLRGRVAAEDVRCEIEGPVVAVHLLDPDLGGSVVVVVVVVVEVHLLGALDSLERLLVLMLPAVVAASDEGGQSFGIPLVLPVEVEAVGVRVVPRGEPLVPHLSLSLPFSFSSGKPMARNGCC
jgi:hypothetical protein